MIKPLSFAKKSRKILLLQLFFCGEYRNRTDDLLTASQNLVLIFVIHFLINCYVYQPIANISFMFANCYCMQILYLCMQMICKLFFPNIYCYDKRILHFNFLRYPKEKE